MPNWCDTQITINGEPAELKKFMELLDNWTSEENSHPNGFGRFWLGNIVLNAGLAESSEDYACRGEIWYGDLDVVSGQIVLYTRTAWAPMNQLWKDVISRYIPDCEFIYCSIEPGFKVFETNDVSLLGQYYVDMASDELPDLDGDMAEEELEDELRTLLESDAELPELISMAEDKYDIVIGEWNYVP